MKHFYLLIVIFFSTQSLSGQYLESFDIANKGILPCPGCSTSSQCPTNDPTSCAMFDFGGVNWTLGGILTSVDQEGLSTNGGDLFFSDVDELACWISPPINISSVASASLEVNVTFFGTWNASDFGQVNYSVDGGSFTTIGNVTGCGGASTFGGGCAFPDGNYTASATGITGDMMTVQVCMDANAQGEIARLAFVSVPESGAVVPVTWNNFSAKSMDDGNLLKWSTASELYNDRFEIERSIGGVSNFEVISRIKGQGDSTEESFYSYKDQDVLPGTVYYYRIKQVDFDGKMSFSRLLSLRTAADDQFSVSPNPFLDEITIDFSKESNVANNLVMIFNAHGVKVKTIDTENRTRISVDLNGLPAGVYYISSSHNQFKKIVKAK